MKKNFTFHRILSQLLTFFIKIIQEKKTIIYEH